MREALILLAFGLSSTVAFAEAIIQFDSRKHDFGKVPETDEKIRHEFVFKNVGNSPLLIERIEASCGCATPLWTTTPVWPGQKGRIQVVYNPLGRKGPFSTTIAVISNSLEREEQLILTGDITPKSRVEDYPYSMATLKLSSRRVGINNIHKGEIKQEDISIINRGEQPVKLSFANVPKHITVTASSQTLDVNQKATLTFTYNSLLCKQWGRISDVIYLRTDKERLSASESSIVVNANILEDFSYLSSFERTNSPILELSNRVVHFGSLKTDKQRSMRVKLRNRGKNPLEIRDISNNNKEISIETKKAVIKGGKRSQLKITLDTAGLRKGRYRRTITLQSNDPQNSLTQIIILWHVK